VTRDLAAIKKFRAEHGDIVMKPLYGKGGDAVFRLAREDLNFGSFYDLFATMFREPWVVQRFLPAVKEGDKRIILVDGEFAGAVNRVPAADDLRSNMVRGGVPKATDLSAREREICKRLGPALRERRLLFVGIDVIGGFAGATADAFTLFERLEAKLEQYPGQLLRAAVELAKDWRTDRYLRRLEAMMIVADKQVSLVLTGTGDVLEPEAGIAGIGSGGNYALAAARALLDAPLDAEAIVRKSLDIAADICVYTNRNVTIESLKS